jgi:Ser/Thr protein kinase RdoA (MazF antagonist)
MSNAGRVYSERLGAISDDQLAAACARLGVGGFVSAAPTQSGLFGQNLFLTTSEGAFVLRGAPHWVKGRDDADYRREDRWQFAKEAYFVEQLHRRTRTPVPWPYLRDEASDIFGWPYPIMPRMPGACYDERTIMTALGGDDRLGVAAALGAMLGEMQRLSSPFAGDFDVDAIALTPHHGGAVSYVIDETRRIARETHDALRDEDREWIEAAAARAAAAGERPCVYVHCDYKLNNLTVLRDADGWRVAGLFDFHEARFSDGAVDLIRTACGYLDTERACARVFLDAYRDAADRPGAMAELLPLALVNDRLKFWAFFARPPAPAAWTQDRTFRDWAQRYLERLSALM